MEFSFGKCAMLIRKSGKRQTTEEIERQNWDRNRKF